jgi:hypothetical protein
MELETMRHLAVKVEFCMKFDLYLHVNEDAIVMGALKK